MRPARLIGLSVIALAALLVLAGATAWLGARSGWARQRAGASAGQLIELPVTIGALAVGFWPAPSLRLGQLEVAQPAGFGPAALLEAEEIEVSLPWRSLWRREPVLHALRIDGVTLRPAVATAGGDNWAALVERLRVLAGTGPSAWSVGEVALERGNVEFHDARSGLRLRLTGIGASASGAAPRVAFPAELRGAAEHGRNIGHFGITGQLLLDPDRGRYAGRELRLRGWAGGEPMPMAGIELPGTVGSLAFDQESGLVTLERGNATAGGVTADFALEPVPGTAGHLQGFSLSSAGFDPQVPARVLGRPLPETRDPAALQSARIQLRGRLEPGQVVLEEFTGTLDETEFGGSLAWPTGPGTPKLRLQADRVDLDRYLPPPAAGAAPAPTSAAPASPQATLEATLARLAALDLDAEIRIAEAQAAGAKIRGLRLAVAP